MTGYFARNGKSGCMTCAKMSESTSSVRAIFVKMVIVMLFSKCMVMISALFNLSSFVYNFPF